MNKSTNPRDLLFDPEIGATDERLVWLSLHAYQYRFRDWPMRLIDSIKAVKR